MADFNWPAYVEWEDTIKFDVLTTKFESGKQQKRLKGPESGKRLFGLTFKKDEVDAVDIYEFFKARKGSFETFTWEHPRTGEVITVRFQDDELTLEVLARKIYEFGLPIEEVL